MKTYYDTLRSDPFAPGNHASKRRQQARSPKWISGSVNTPVGRLPQVSTEWSSEDYWGQLKARTGSFRMNYRIEAGLYAVGEPDEHSDLLVSANYKLSFDLLRRELGGMNVWILVLDTGGINVWCAAGKGSFSSEALIGRIEASRLDKLVSHRRLIVPQLAAPGVSAADVKQQSGFRVLFGPVRAGDIPAYIQAGCKASREMRRVKFPLKDRLVLTPVELIPLLKKFPLYALLVLLLFGLQPSGIRFNTAWEQGAPFLALGLIAMLAGSVFTPALLPFLPFRSFSAKGWLVGLFSLLLSLQFLEIESLLLQIVAHLVFPLATSYIALQFTGSTTFTGISAVKKELRIGMPIYKLGTSASAILFILYKLF
ncbi:MAG: hypothetical protein GY801_20470 [bacterium]|nr:hypothetical protein [bacterium]